jgi:hypothetical protein
LTTVPSMNAKLEPRIVAAKIHLPFSAVGTTEYPARTAPSSAGGLHIIAVPFAWIVRFTLPVYSMPRIDRADLLIQQKSELLYYSHGL